MTRQSGYAEGNAAAMRAALTFAEWAAEVDASLPDDLDIAYSGNRKTRVTIGDLRALAACNAAGEATPPAEGGRDE